MTLSQTQQKEAAFWDAAVARSHGDASAPVGPEMAFDPQFPWLGDLGAPVLMQAAWRHLDIGPGARVLDLGCGAGFNAIWLAHRGAHVRAVDVSAASVARAQARAEASGVAGRIDFEVAGVEHIDAPDGAFDAACGLFILHHVALGPTMRELSRLLRPGGRGAFIETFGHNPALMAARATLPGRFGIEKASSDDEAPLDRRAIAEAAAHFEGKLDEAFPTLVAMRLGGYLRALNNPAGAAALGAADALLGAIAPLRRWSYFGLLTLARAGGRDD